MDITDDDPQDSLVRWFLGKPNPIEYLLERKFPDYKLIMTPVPLTLSEISRGGPIIDPAKQQKRKDEIEAYKAELKAKPLAELKALFDAERDKQGKATMARLAREENERFFNLSSATADFDFWAKATYWKLDEAIALSLGKSPDVVKWANVEPVARVSRFARTYSQRRELALRAKNWNQLYDPILPSLFLAWARRIELDVPPELTAAIEKRGVVIADWKDYYDKAKSLVEEQSEMNQQLLAANGKLEAERDRLAGLYEELRETAWEGFSTDSDTYPQELDVAMQAWRAVSRSGISIGMTAKKEIAAWLAAHYPQLSNEARERISVVCNWEKSGGRRKEGS